MRKRRPCVTPARFATSTTCRCSLLDDRWAERARDLQDRFRVGHLAGVDARKHPIHQIVVDQRADGVERWDCDGGNREAAHAHQALAGFRVYNVPTWCPGATFIEPARRGRDTSSLNQRSAMTCAHRWSTVVVLCLLVIFTPGPSESQSLVVDRAKWKSLEGADETKRHSALQWIADENQDLLESIAKSDRDPLIRAAATGRLRSQTLLARLAIDDPEARIRVAATGKLTDAPLLLRIATTDSSAGVRRAAAANRYLTDQAQLAVLAQADPESAVRSVAVLRLTDQAVLGRIAQSDSDALVRTRAVERVSDQAVLAGLATATHEDVRLGAVGALTDQTVLAKVARTDPSRGVRARAVARLKDQAELAAAVALSDPDGVVRKAAVGLLTDQSVLARVAKSDKDPDVALAAVRSITDEGVRAEVAASAVADDVRELALGGIDDQRVIAALARKDPAPRVRYKAIAKLTDQGVLADLAKNDPEPKIRIQAIARVSGQSVLADVARAGPDWEVRLSAVGKLDDQATLAAIAKSDAWAIVAEKALSRLKEPGAGLLEEIVKTGATLGARMAALERIDDRQILERFARSGADPWIRGLAILSLEPNPASDIVIQLAHAGADGTIPADKSAINFFARSRPTNPVQMEFVAKVPSPSGNRILTPGVLSVDLTVRNRNTTVGYRYIRFRSRYSLRDGPSGPTQLWHGESTIAEVPVGGLLETESREPEDLLSPVPWGTYSVERGTLEVVEAMAFVLVPVPPGTKALDRYDRRVLGDDHRFTVSWDQKSEAFELTAGVRAKR
jgi:hypothetical protein